MSLRNLPGEIVIVFKVQKLYLKSVHIKHTSSNKLLKPTEITDTIIHIRHTRHTPLNTHKTAKQIKNGNIAKDRSHVAMSHYVLPFNTYLHTLKMN